MKYGIKDFYRQFTDVLYAHFLWIVVSFLGILITFGASTTALFKVMFQIFKKDEPTHVTKVFFDSFKESFIESTCVWLIIIVFSMPLILMMHHAVLANNIYLIVIGYIATYQMILFLVYIFPVIAVFKSKSIFSTIKNTMLLQNRYLLTNLKLLGSLAIFVLSMVYVHEAFVLLVIPSYGFLIAFHLKAVFNPYIDKFQSKTNKGDDYELFKL